MRVLEQAIQFGYPVLLENIGETIDPGLNPILQKAFIKSGKTVITCAHNCIKFVKKDSLLLFTLKYFERSHLPRIFD